MENIMATKQDHRDRRKRKEKLDKLQIDEFENLEIQRAIEKEIALRKKWDNHLKGVLTYLDEQMKCAYDSVDNRREDVIQIYHHIQKNVDELIAIFRKEYEESLGFDYGDELREILTDKYILPFENMEILRKILPEEKEGRREQDKKEEMERAQLEAQFKDELDGLSASSAGTNESLSSMSSGGVFSRSNSALVFDQKASQCLASAMDCAKNSKSTLRSGKKNKQTKLEQCRSEYEKAEEGEQKQNALLAYIYAAAEPRKTMFFQAKFGETASAAAFYNALTHDGARKMVSDALGLDKVLPKPTGKNLAEFANAVRNAFKDKPEPTAPHPKK
jgi:hypothetical protein